MHQREALTIIKPGLFDPWTTAPRRPGVNAIHDETVKGERWEKERN